MSVAKTGGQRQESRVTCRGSYDGAERHIMCSTCSATPFFPRAGESHFVIENAPTASCLSPQKAQERVRALCTVAGN